MQNEFEQLISQESLSFQRSGSGLTFQSLWEHFNELSGDPKFFSPVRLFDFDELGTFSDALVIGAYSSSHPSYSVDTVQYVTAWAPVATFELEYSEFFRMYLTESTAIQNIVADIPGTDNSASSPVVLNNYSNLTWRNSAWPGQDTGSV